MADQSPDYKQLFFEEKRRREEEQRRREEEQRKREEAEQKTRKTTLPQFLDACHNHLHAGLTIQSDFSLSTKGDPSNARDKKRPKYVREWTDFPARQVAIWDRIVRSDFMTESRFTSMNTMEELGEMIRRRMMSSELDVHHFERSTVEDHISTIIREFHEDRRLRREFYLRGSVRFENHANTLSPDDQLSGTMEAMDLSSDRRRRSPRLIAKQKNKENRESEGSGETGGSQKPTAAIANNRGGFGRPRADQFCVYNTSNGSQIDERVAAFVAEYKAPHKLTLAAIREGLQDMDLDDILQRKDGELPNMTHQRLVAAAITQTFSYMVAAGLEYGYVCTGEAFIFLRVPEDPATVYYFLSVPKVDVGGSTGWSQESDSNNRLHLTAVAQVLAFTLQALQTPPRPYNWRTKAHTHLSTWEYSYEEVLDDVTEVEESQSNYCPSSSRDKLLRVSPIGLRKRYAAPGPSSECRPASQSITEELSDSDQDDSASPSQRPPGQGLATAQYSPSGRSESSSSSSTRGDPAHRQAQNRSFCTQQCLLGLVNGGSLDSLCPNFGDHGDDVHRINNKSFLRLLREQLAQTLDSNFDEMGRPGSRGVPYKVTLASHGYTVAAKCVPVEFARCLSYEATMYDRLRTIQGRYVPVHLGIIDLESPCYYEGIAVLSRMMLLGYGGVPISQLSDACDREQAVQQAEACTVAVHQLGILHKDLMPRNILWNEDTRKVLLIDFERAKTQQARRVLSALPVNRKRRQAGQAGGIQKRGIQKLSNRDDPFAAELKSMKREVLCM